MYKKKYKKYKNTKKILKSLLVTLSKTANIILFCVNTCCCYDNSDNIFEVRLLMCHYNNDNCNSSS